MSIAALKAADFFACSGVAAVRVSGQRNRSANDEPVCVESDQSVQSTSLKDSGRRTRTRTRTHRGAVRSVKARMAHSRQEASQGPNEMQKADSDGDLQNHSHNGSEAATDEDDSTQRALPAQTSAPGTPTAAASPLKARTGDSFPPFAFPTSFMPPKPDSSGAAIGIPIPLQAMPRAPNGTTLPPMPAASAQPVAAAAAQPASAADSPQSTSTPPRPAVSNPQYRKVFVPSTVVHNGVAQQMLVPMLCVVAPLQPGALAAGKLAAQPVCMPASLPALHGSAPPRAAQRASSCGGRTQRGAGSKRSRRQQESHKALGPGYMPLKRMSSQSRYGTRSRALPVQRPAVEASQQFESRIAQQGTDALNMLADAALLELC